MKKWVVVIVAFGLLVSGMVMAVQAQQKGKAYQDLQDAKKDAPATFDGSKSNYVPPPSIPERGVVTPGDRNAYVPKQYKSLHTNPPPKP